MSEIPEFRVKVSGVNTIEIALAMLFIAFWGEPDLVDALIYWLMKG